MTLPKQAPSAATLSPERQPRSDTRIDATSAASPGSATARRHPGDVVRLVAAGAVVAATAVVARHHGLGSFERDSFRLVNDLPGWLSVPVQGVMQAGALAAVPVAAGAAVAAGRRPLARDVACAGGAAWVAAKLIKLPVGRARPAALLHAVLLRGGPQSGLGFPSGHAAVAAALAGAASPYLSRRGRRLAWALVPAVGLARIYVGAHLPVDVIGGAALGWGIAAAVHLLFGIDRSGADSEAVRRALEAAGRPLLALTRAGVDARGSVPF